MKLNLPLEYHNIQDPQDLADKLSATLKQILQVINGRVAIPDNLDVHVTSVTFSAANASTPVTHRLDRIPQGYIVAKRSANFTIFDGSGSNTTSVIYLQASAAGTATIVLF